MIGLYVHIPFCEKKCHYCDFVITTAQAPAERQRFLEALEKEAAHYAEQFRGKKFSTLYIGGGTPSRLSAGEARRVFSILRKHFVFEEGVEIALEANPEDLDREKLRAYKELGIRRVSLGAQSFNEKTLKTANRAHGAAKIYEAFSLLREEGFGNVNLDLMLSLPGESFADVEHSLNELKKLDPEHVSVYELTIEKNTVFADRHAKGNLGMPAEEAQLAFLSHARDFLKKNGWCHYELLNYAKPGFESRHNRLYWANGEYLGLGPGAFSYFGGRRFRYALSVEEYFSKTARGDWRAAEEESLTPEKREIESLLLALRLTDGADLSRFRLPEEITGTAIPKLEEKKLLSRDGSRVRLTAQGQLFAESVFAELSSPC